MPSRNKLHTLPRMAVASLVGALALLGCATGPKTFEITANADQVINRDAGGRPLSVVAHVYQLKDAGEFSKLTFDMLASGRPLPELLGKDLLAMSEVMLVPGGSHTGTDKIHPDAKHVGIVAFFRQPDPQYWRMLADADQVRSNGLHFRIQDCYLALTAPKPTLIPGQPASPPTSCSGNELRPGSVAANTVGPQPRQSVASNNRRGNISDSGKQAIESMLRKKP